MASTQNLLDISNALQTATIRGGDPGSGGPTQTLKNSPSVMTTVSGGTTTTTATYDNGVVDVSLIPFMRSIAIRFVAHGLRPNRNVFFFFDGSNITNRIVKSDFLELNELSANTGFSKSIYLPDILNSGSQNSAVILISRQNINPTDNLNSNVATTRILEISNTAGQFANGSSILGSVSGAYGTVKRYTARGMFNLGNLGGNTFSSISSNVITLPISTAVMANNFWGTDGSNNIVLIPHGRRGITQRVEATANIISFNNVTRQLTITQPQSSLFPYEPAPITANQLSLSFIQSSATGSDFYTTSEGSISGIFVVPAGTFRTGDRIFRIIDVNTNIETDCTTRADYTFTASGIEQTKNDVVLSSTSVKAVITPPLSPPVYSPTPTFQESHHSGAPGGTGAVDPVAQTFFVDPITSPNGIFISSVEIWFKVTDPILPVTVSIRPTVNGYPSSGTSLEFAESTMQSEDITEYPGSPYSTGTTPYPGTIFKMPCPIYCAPGEYALVIKSDSPDYEVWVSKLGEVIVGSTRTVSEQPYVGSFFESQNGSTWTPSQETDLMFRMYKCVFNPSGTIQLQNMKPEANIFADVLYTHSEDFLLPNTTVTYTHSSDGGSTFYSYSPDSDYNLPSRVNINNSGPGAYVLNGTLTSGNPDISPLIKTDLYKTLAIENIINNANISSADIVIVNGGHGFPANANVSINLSGGFSSLGYTAVAYGIANTSGSGNGPNGVSTIIVTDGGAVYSNSANAGIVGGDNTVSLAISSELHSHGGPAVARYISKPVTLADGFAASDIRLFADIYKPLGTDVTIYYKIKNALDPDTFDSKNYFLMNQRTSSSRFSLNSNDVIEYEYGIQSNSNSTTYTSGTTTYTTFNQFAIKIILTSTNTTVVPQVFNLRAIALPGSS